MDDDVRTQLDALEQKIDATYASAEKTRKYILWTVIISAAVIVLPMIGLMFVIPTFLSSYGNMQQTINGL